MGFKIIGIILILSSGTLIGWYISLQYIKRIKQLNELQLAINFLDAEISFNQTLLKDALEKVATRINYPLSEIFNNSARELSLKKGISFNIIWDKEVNKNFEINSLREEDKQILLEWGHKLGTTGVEKQEKINKLISKKLELEQKNAREQADKRVKLSRYTGVLLSLLIIILFY
ncbi:MAG: hypothetical protein ACOC1O_02345 [bacterium]